MRIVFILFISAALGMAACQQGDGASGPYFEDANLQRIYARMMEEMAPDRGWERVRYIAFDRVVDRPGDTPSRREHRWDVWGGCTGRWATRAARRWWP